jgi:hypothetical protein
MQDSNIFFLFSFVAVVGSGMDKKQDPGQNIPGSATLIRGSLKVGQSTWSVLGKSGVSVVGALS